MKFLNNRTKIFTVLAMFLLMASLALTTDITVKAQEGSHGGEPGTAQWGPLKEGVTPDVTVDTVAYMSITPNPVGVGQEVLVNIWIIPGTQRSRYGVGYTVDIQKPDGKTNQVGPLNSYYGDDTAWFTYRVDQPGTWKFKFSQGGAYYPAGIYPDAGWPSTFGSGVTNYTYSMWYKPSSTEWQNLTVQNDLVYSWPAAPLPNDYWTRPVQPELREWTPILGNYPWTGAIYYPNGRVLYSSNYKYTPYVQAPNTAHIVWKDLGAMAGLVGEGYGYEALTSTSPQPNIIYQGRAFRSVSKVSPTGTGSQSYWQSFDIRTGKLYWERPVYPGETLPSAITYSYGTSEVPGAEARAGFSANLIAITNPSGNNSGRIVKYNTLTGAVSSNYSGLPVGLAGAASGGATIFGGGGNIIYSDPYAFAIQTIGTGANVQYRLINFSVELNTDNFTQRMAPKTDGYQGLWNISWPFNSLGTVDYDAGIAATASSINGRDVLGYWIRSVDLKTGALLTNFTSSNTTFSTSDEVQIQTGSSLVVNRGKIALAMANSHWTAWDGKTGKKVWQSELSGYPWGAWYAYATSSYDFNESKSAIIVTTYNGIEAIDWDDGKMLWSYSDPSVPFEGPYGVTPFFVGVTIADGKVYSYNTEHTPTAPITRGWKIHCLNVTNGQLLWKCGTPGSSGAIADGYMTVSSYYDGYMYVYGKGKSQTTVTAPVTNIQSGNSVLIQGTVMDLSPAQPNTPCVAKESMTLQMENIHLQQPIDGIWHNETINGVPVAITAIDASGNVIDIGTTTTNGYYGTFSIEWTLPAAGKYTIMASFAGDDSYGSSSAATGLLIGAASAATPTPTPIQQQDVSGMFFGSTAAIIVAIVIVGILLFLALRRRQ